jgi:D-threonate/D-erythronate kinase
LFGCHKQCRFGSLFYAFNKPKYKPMKIRIITDDFTSATDGIALFAQHGWLAGAVLTSRVETTAEDLSVLSVDTDSRTCAPAQAAQRVGAWAQRWAYADLLVKQFDSTLRGPVAAECLAAWLHSGRPHMVVAAAFPAAGRTVRGGVVQVDGVSVHKTNFRDDPLNPVIQSDICALFASMGVEAVSAVNAQAAQQLLERGCKVVVMDADTELNLLHTVENLVARTDVLWAGSTGLVRAMAQHYPAPVFTAQRENIPSYKPWVVVGSRNPRSRQQIAALMREGVMCISSPATQGNADVEAAQLANQLAAAVQAGECDGMVVTGGATAKAVAHALQAYNLIVLREVEPGVPLCLLYTGARVLPMVTKAGGFGDDDTLLRCVRALQIGNL